MERWKGRRADPEDDRQDKEAPAVGGDALGQRPLQYPVERYVGIQDYHIRDWQLACIYFGKESSTLVKVLKVYKLIATVCGTQHRNTVFHKGLSVPLFLESDGVS